MGHKISRRKFLEKVIGVGVATIQISSVEAAPHPFIPLPAPSTLPGCIFMRDHSERYRWQRAKRRLQKEKKGDE